MAIIRISEKAKEHIKKTSEQNYRSIAKEIDFLLFGKKKKEPIKRFIKPNMTDLFNYINENNYSVDPEKFLNYYESNGWKVGKANMKDWKAAVRNWNKSNFETEQKEKEENHEIYHEARDLVKEEPINKDDFYARARKEAEEKKKVGPLTPDQQKAKRLQLFKQAYLGKNGER